MRDKPAAKVMTPSEGASPDGLETLREVQEHAVRQGELDQRNQAKTNKVAALLGSAYYIQEKTWPFLTWEGQQLSVSEFYPEEKIAIDKYFHFDDWELSMTAHKKKVLKEHGIRYAFLTPDKSLADLEVELG